MSSIQWKDCRLSDLEERMARSDTPEDGPSHRTSQAKGERACQLQSRTQGSQTLEDVWEFLDEEYGDPERLTAQRVKDLHSFRYSAKAKTDSAKVRELHQIWREVYTDLEVVNAVTDNLDNAHCIQGFISKFPKELKKDFVRFEGESGNKARRKSDLMNAFLWMAKKEVQLLDRFEDKG